MEIFSHLAFIAHGIPDGPLAVLWIILALGFLLVSSPIFWASVLASAAIFVVVQRARKDQPILEDE